MNYMAIADLCRLACFVLFGGAVIFAIYAEKRGGNRFDHQPSERKTPK